MKCPECNKIIDKVRVYSECWQWGYLDDEKPEINDYSSIEEVTETVSVTCPECGKDITDSIELF